MFGAEFADAYDITYRCRGKDYAAEVAEIVRQVRRHRPRAASLLDVACGTGEHLAHFRREFAEVAGLDRSPFMRRIAEAKLPGVPIHPGDMCAFRLGRSFDVVTCLFSSVGYLPSVAALIDAVGAMAAHLVPGGVLVVEPLWFPETFQDGYVAGDVFDGERRTLARVSHSRRDGRAVRMDIHYLVGGDDGVRHFAESHHNTLFSRDEYDKAFAAANCPARFLPELPAGRGLFVGVRH